MSGLTSDPVSTNSARHRRYLTPFPRGKQTPTVYQIGYKRSCTYDLAKRIMHLALRLVQHNSSCSLFSFVSIFMTCTAGWKDAKVTNLLVLFRFLLMPLALASKGESLIYEIVK